MFQMPPAQGKLQTEFKTSENLAVDNEALRSGIFYISAQKWLDVLPFYFVQLTVLTDDSHVPESSLYKVLVNVTVLSTVRSWFFAGGWQSHLEDGSFSHFSSRRQILPFQIATVGRDRLEVKVVNSHWISHLFVVVSFL